MLYAVLKSLHLLAMVVWLGGMVAMLFCVKPAAQRLEPALRVPLLYDASRRFFGLVVWAIAVVLVSGVWMIGHVARLTKASGASFNMPVDWMVMSGLGVLMVLVFAQVRVGLMPRVARAIQVQDWAAGARTLMEIRRWVGFNVALGVFIVVATQLGQAS